MRKRNLLATVAITLAASFLLSSCIGRFALTHKVLNWNHQIGTKFVNELVFLAFWILPVYEVTSVADLLVINSIEFWSGNNPVEAYTKVVKSDSGNYLVECDGKGYDIINMSNGDKIRLDFDNMSQTWSVETAVGSVPFLKYIDNKHVDLITPEGNFKTVEIPSENFDA